MATVMKIVCHDVTTDVNGCTRLYAEISIDLTLPTEADALQRIPRLLRGLESRLLNGWLVDDLADGIEYNQDDR